MPNPGPISPAELLALEEALLDYCEEREHRGFLHFWEVPWHFVVLGYSRRVAEEVHQERCHELGIPVLRRASGGGTVLQGPGCLSFTLVLPIESNAAFGGITSTNQEIMKRHRSALEQVIGQPVEVKGCTDLTLGGRKFCGNAQRRKRRCLLFHGSFLLAMEISMIEQVLQIPPQKPEYRNGRSHTEFLVNLGVPAAEIKGALVNSWPGVERLDEQNLPGEITSLTQKLVQSRYGAESWNLKF